MIHKLTKLRTSCNSRSRA